MESNMFGALGAVGVGILSMVLLDSLLGTVLMGVAALVFLFLGGRHAIAVASSQPAAPSRSVLD